MVRGAHFTKSISASLSQSFSPPSLNSAAIVPLPRQTISSLNWLLCRLKLQQGWPITHQHLHLLRDLKPEPEQGAGDDCMSVWFLSCTTAHREALKGSLTEAKTLVTGPSFPPWRKPITVGTCTHSGHQVFKLLSSHRRSRTLRSLTTRPQP